MTAGERPYRYSRRWQGFDYRAGRIYFVTICTAHRQLLLSVIDARCKVRLSAVGVNVVDAWEALPQRFENAYLYGFVAMPDHIYGLIEIVAPERTEPEAAGTSVSLGQIIGAFKSLSARAANQTLGRRDVSFWQRGYHDRVVRSDDELERLRWYIDENPARWAASRLSE